MVHHENPKPSVIPCGRQSSHQCFTRHGGRYGKELQVVGFKVKRIIRTGFPWREILDVENEERPSIIVFGSHGRSNLSDMFFGWVSDRVVRKCKRPVMVVKRDK